MPGTLHIVSTPIGNLEDITLRALRTLREAHIIAAEDTRVTRKLLSHYDIHTPLISYHQNSTEGRVEQIVEMLLEDKNVALVSDAGTPGVSDPGHELISLCISSGIRVEPIPGPTAVITALVISGMPTAHFAFDGFPPRRESELRAFFRSLKCETRTICLYEAPLRLRKTLDVILRELGDRPIAIVREATKMFEEVFRGTVTGAIDSFSQRKVRGEIVIVLRGALPDELARCEPVALDLESRLAELIKSGYSDRDAVRQCVVEFKLSRREVYAAALKLKAREQPGQSET